jgi:GDPmannose 4,6-dehydratase
METASKKALITGITGQDGSYLAELLLSRGYEVHGIVRRSSTFNRGRIEHLFQDPRIPEARLFLHYGDLADSGNIFKLINQIRPDEVYHLGAMSHVRVSFDMPEYTADVGALGTLRILEAIKNSGLSAKFYNAASSEMFGLSTPPQNEKTIFHPRSPYAVSKVFSYYITQNYREAYDMFACSGILFNHEGPRRGESFVTRKITLGIARIKAGLDQKLYLGNLEAKRDWGFTPEYIEAMWLMLQQPKPDDFVIATGETHSIKEFLSAAFVYAGLGDWQRYVEIDPRYFRPAEVEVLVGDSAKAKEGLGWQPKVKFNDLVKIMVDADMKRVGEGDKIIQEKFPNRWWKND